MPELIDITLEENNHVAKVVLNRPGQLNALNMQILKDLEVVCSRIEQSDTAIRALILAGAGDAFCAGADLKYVTDARLVPGAFESYARYLNKVFNRIEELPVPTIAAIQGYCFAGGLELALCCDFRIVADNVTIGDQHANFGLVPGGGCTQRLPRLIGPSRAKEVLLTGSWLKAAEAEKFGLANQVAPLHGLMETAEAFAAKFITKSPLTARVVKRLVDKGMQVDLRSALEMEVLSVVQSITNSADAAEGLRAFSERRKPTFVGH